MVPARLGPLRPRLSQGRRRAGGARAQKGPAVPQGSQVVEGRVRLTLNTSSRLLAPSFATAATPPRLPRA